ncbi:hypothetical protein [Bradyrhizobium sp.]|uniref:hypothetical protein n=1 Tax=Bradyrhizobium sp. TaxID=376 RepID=UPI003C31398F
MQIDIADDRLKSSIPHDDSLLPDQDRHVVEAVRRSVWTLSRRTRLQIGDN